MKYVIELDIVTPILGCKAVTKVGREKIRKFIYHETSTQEHVRFALVAGEWKKRIKETIAELNLSHPYPHLSFDAFFTCDQQLEKYERNYGAFLCDTFESLPIGSKIKFGLTDISGNGAKAIGELIHETGVHKGFSQWGVKFNFGRCKLSSITMC